MTTSKPAPARATPARNTPLPLEFPGVHHMDEEEVEAVTRVVRSRSLFRYYGIDLQHETDIFETEFARFLGVPHALAVSSGSGALHVALAALGVGPGQEVIVPAYLWVAVVAAVVNQGAIPVLADIDRTFGLDPVAVEKAITPRTRGVVAVHMSGAPCDVLAIREVTRRHGLFLLEDCAQCAGGSIRGQNVGTFGDMGTFSFQMNKNMTSGEGGAVVTGDAALYKRAFACHDLGYARDESGRLVFDVPDLCLWGKGYRMDEMRAAVLRVQLRKLPRIIDAMRRSKSRIHSALEKHSWVGTRTIRDPEGDTGGFLITTYPDAAIARRVNAALRDEGIVTFPQGISNVVMTEWGLHLYSNIPSLVQRRSTDPSGFPWTLPQNDGAAARYEKGTCPVADDLFERSILLAIPSCLTPRDEDDIVGAFDTVLTRERR